MNINIQLLGLTISLHRTSQWWFRFTVAGYGISSQGIEFRYKGDEMIRLWPSNREGTRDPYLSISWGKAFPSLKALDLFNEDCAEYFRRQEAGDKQIVDAEGLLAAAQAEEPELSLDEAINEARDITYMVDAVDVEKLQAELAQTKAQLRELAACSQHALQELDSTLGANTDLLRNQLNLTEDKLARADAEIVRLRDLVAAGWQHPEEINRLKRALCDKIDELDGYKRDEMSAMEAFAYGADEARWTPGTTAVQTLIAENLRLRQQTIRGLHWPAEIEAELDRLVAEVHEVRQELAKTAEAADDFHESWVDAADDYREMKDMHDALVDELALIKAAWADFDRVVRVALGNQP